MIDMILQVIDVVGITGDWVVGRLLCDSLGVVVWVGPRRIGRNGWGQRIYYYMGGMSSQCTCRDESTIAFRTRTRLA